MTQRREDSLQCILPGTMPWPLFGVTETRAIERAALAELAPNTLMQRAGLAAARLAMATRPRARSAHALAGPGNNGGDALLASALLQRQGWAVRASLLGDPAHLPPDAQQALAQARQAGVAIDLAVPERIDAALAIDGLLGIGVSRAPEGPIAAAIVALNGSDRPVLAIDQPTGLDADRGVVLGAQAVRATETLSLLTLKPGLFTGQGRDQVGRVWLDGLGVDLPQSRSWLLGAPIDTMPSHDSHKGRFGDVTVVGGAAGMVGAAQLAARAALAAGAGRVYLCALGGDNTGTEAVRPELMHRQPSDLADPSMLASQTVVCGCGGGEAMRALLPPLLSHAARLVLDADALNAIASEPALAIALRARGVRGRPTVLTPHPLEAARLLGASSASVQADRLGNARALANQFGCWIVLKGSGSVIAAPNGALSLNPTGNPLLSAAGTGDVLAGWIGGAWSRAGAVANPMQIAGEAVWLHGRAGDQVAASPRPPRSLQAGDLIEAMRGLSD